VAQGFGPPLDLERRCELRSDDAEPLLHGGYQSWFPSEGADYRMREQGAYAGGEPVGCWSRWHPNGTLESTGCYVAGKPQGRWAFFYESGRILSDGRYRFGKEHGAFRYWHPSGGLQAEGEFRDGRKRGIWSFFDPEGRPEEQRHFDEQGRIFERIEFRDGRKVADDALLQNMLCSEGAELVASEFDPDQGLDVWCRRFDAHGRPVPHGAYRELFLGGLVHRQGVYDQGRKQDLWRTYDAEGVRTEEGPYERGLATGLWSTLYPDGSPETQTHYLRGVAHGPYRRFSPGGALRVEGRSREGLRDGIWTYFTSSGALDHLVSFRAGEIEDVTEFEAGQPYRCPEGTERSLGELDSGEYVLACGRRDPNGPLVREGRQSTFRDDGGRASIESFRDGQVDGPHLRFHPGGDVAVEGAFESGRAAGVWLERDTLGRVISRTAHDERGEHRVELHANGALRALAHREAGVEQGVEVRWYASGLSQQKGRWASGKRTGCWYYWDETGRLERLVRYGEDGEPLEVDDPARCDEIDAVEGSAAPEALP
jgi:antitoxin component YwqK of YwqJK toxin-antitoxin module